MPTSYPEMYLLALTAFAAILTAVGTIMLVFMAGLYVVMFIKRLRYFHVNRSAVLDKDSLVKMAAVYAWRDIQP